MTNQRISAKPSREPPEVGRSAVDCRAESLFWGMLFSLAIIVGFFAHIDGGHASFWGIEGPKCLVERLLGDHRFCPGFGLTRSTSLALQGDFRGSFGMNPGGIGVACTLLGGLAFYFLAFFKGYYSRKMLLMKSFGRVLFLGSVFGVWGYRIILLDFF